MIIFEAQSTVKRAISVPVTAAARPQMRAAGIATQVKTVHEESKGRYGAPRVHGQLRNEGRRHSRRRADRLMRVQGPARPGSEAVEEDR